MKKVLFDENLSLAYGEKGRELVEDKYNWDIINKQILDIYNRFL